MKRATSAGEKRETMRLSDADEKFLLETARRSVESIYGGTPPAIDYDERPALGEKRGAFTTITKEGDLRGCIGYIIGRAPLFETIVETARLAATEDPRFPRVGASEIAEIEFEISVLSEPEPLESYDDVVVGEHGLILNDAAGSGVLLPQVPLEHGMDREAYLNAICRKAGLPEDRWRRKKVNLQTFTARVFSEEDYR